MFLKSDVNRKSRRRDKVYYGGISEESRSQKDTGPGKPAQIIFGDGLYTHASDG